MVTQAPKKSATFIAVSFALSCVGLIIFVWVAFGGSIPLAAQGYRVKAVFAETGLLVPNADVRIAGVNVGKVVSVSADGTKSIVVLDLDHQFSPIPENTRAILREKTLLGEAYVDLSTGNGAGPKIPDGGQIPSDHVAQTQQLDQVLNAFTPPVQKDFQEFLEGTGASLNGQGQDLNDAFGNFGPAATELDEVSQVLNNEGSDLSAAIRNSGTVLTALGDRGSDLQELINSGESVFSATAAEDTALRSGIEAFPPFLAQLKTTLHKLNGTLQIARPSLRVLQPVAPLVKPALEKLTQLTGPLLTLLHTAPGVLREAKTVIPKVTTFVNAFKPLVDATLPAAEQIVPMINVVSDYRDQLVDGMVNLSALLNAQTTANTTTDSDGIAVGEAKYVRQVLSLGPDTTFGQTTRNAAIRSNPYFAPGELDRIGTSGFEAASCAGTGGSGNIPCVLQPSYAWGHGIGTTYYPRVTATTPAKTSAK